MSGGIPNETSPQSSWGLRFTAANVVRQWESVSGTSCRVATRLVSRHRLLAFHVSLPQRTQRTTNQAAAKRHPSRATPETLTFLGGVTFLSLMKLSAEGAFPSPKASLPLVQPRNSGPPHHGLLGLVTPFRVGRLPRRGWIFLRHFRGCLHQNQGASRGGSVRNLLTSLNLLEITNGG